jgi:cell division cycle 2-like protein
MSSRWADTEEDAKEAARIKAEKAAKKAAKEERKRREAEAEAAAAAAAAQQEAPPAKRRRVGDEDGVSEKELKLLRFPGVEIVGCRHVDNYERLNHIEEGSYGVVSRARDTATGEVVALKKLKLEREMDGFPITSLREIQTLMAARHPNVVGIKEVVMGDSLKE